MWIPEVTTMDRIIRAAVGYIFLLVAFRLMGKRQVGQLTPFDLVVLLIVSNVLQNAMIGPDNSITGGLIGAMTIFFLNGLVARLTMILAATSRLGTTIFAVRSMRVAGVRAHNVSCPLSIRIVRRLCVMN